MVELRAQIIKVEDIIGRKILGKSKEQLGEIKDIALDQITGYAAYVVISAGGLLGIGARLYAFLWQDIVYDREEDAYTIHLTKKQFEDRISFPNDEWPDRVEALFKDKKQAPKKVIATKTVAQAKKLTTATKDVKVKAKDKEKIAPSNKPAKSKLAVKPKVEVKPKVAKASAEIKASAAKSKAVVAKSSDKKAKTVKSPKTTTKKPAKS